MKTRKRYVLFINSMLKTAYFGGRKFDQRISAATLGTIYDCTFRELVDNLHVLSGKGYTIAKRTY